MAILSALMLTGSIGVASAEPPVSAPVRVVRGDEVRLYDPFGSCNGNGRAFDLRRLATLEHPSIEIDGPNGPLRVSVSGEMVRIDLLEDGSPTQVFGTDVASKAEPNVDLDVELKLGYINHTLVVYWKETYHHRTYRQGLFRIVGERIEFLCEGRGGMTSR